MVNQTQLKSPASVCGNLIFLVSFASSPGEKSISVMQLLLIVYSSLRTEPEHALCTSTAVIPSYLELKRIVTPTDRNSDLIRRKFSYQ